MGSKIRNIKYLSSFSAENKNKNKNTIFGAQDETKVKYIGIDQPFDLYNIVHTNNCVIASDNIMTQKQGRSQRVASEA